MSGALGELNSSDHLMYSKSSSEQMFSSHGSTHSAPMHHLAEPHTAATLPECPQRRDEARRKRRRAGEHSADEMETATGWV